MQINSATLNTLYTVWNAKFKDGLKAGPPRIYDQIAMKVMSQGREEAYPLLGQLPQVREWLGDRQIKSIGNYSWTIPNRDFEATISVARNDVQDDRLGTYATMFEEFGQRAGEFPDKLLAELLPAAFSSKCYDNQNFFDTLHPVDPYDGHSGATETISNMQAGEGPAWYLLDLSRTLKPFIYQERIPFTLVRKDRPEDDNVFLDRQMVYGTDARCNVGFGLWQLAFGSKAPLNAENYEAARTAMTKFRGDGGHRLGVLPTHMLVPTELESAGRAILKKANLAGGEGNIWSGTAELLVSRWL